MNTVSIVMSALGLISITAGIMMSLFGGGGTRERVIKVEGRVDSLEKILTTEVSNMRGDLTRLEHKLDEFFRPTGDYRGGS